MAGSQNRIEFTVAAKADTASFKALQDQLSNVGIAIERAAKKNGGMTQELKNAKSAAMDLQNILNKSWNEKLGTYNMSTMNKELKASGATLTEYQHKLASIGPEGVTAANKIGTAILRTNAQVKEGNKLLNSMFTSMKNTVSWGISSSVFNKLTSELSHAVAFAEKLDTSLNNIRIVTGKSAQEMKGVAEWANIAAKNLSASTTDLTNAALIYYQQGDTEQEAQRKAEITTKVANVTDQDTATAADQMTAIWNGFQAQAEDMESYGDKMAKVAATTSSSFQELATGMQKVAAASNTAGVSFDQLNAQMSTIISVTREAPESVGTALKTIYARMGDLKTDGAATDEDGFTTKLGTVTADMQKMGINILDETGAMREMGEVIEEVGDKWQGWTRNQQEAAAVSLAGKRQYTQLIALFDNWDKYTAAKATSEGAEGTLDEQQDIYDDKLDAAKQRLSAAKESIYNDLFDTEAITPMINGLTSIVEALDRVIDSFGGGAKAIAAFGVIATKVFSKQINKEVANFMGNKFIDNNNKRLAAEAQTQATKESEKAGQYKAAYTTTGDTRSLNAYAQAVGSEAELQTQARYYQQMTQLQEVLTEEQRASVQETMNQISALEGEKAELQAILAIRKEEDNELNEDNFSREKAYGAEIIEERRQQTENAQQAQTSINDSMTIDSTESLLLLESDVAEQQELIKTLPISIEQASSYQEKLNKNLDESKKITDSLNTVNKTRAKNGQTELKTYTDVKTRLAEVNNEIKQRAKSGQEIDNDLEEEKRKLQQILDSYKKIEETQKEIKKDASDTVTTAQKREQDAKDYGQTRSEYDNKADKGENLQSNLDSTLDEAQKIKSMQDAVSLLTNGLTGLASAISIVQSLGAIWTDSDISIGEKLSQTVMTLSMTLPMLASSWSTISGILKEYKAAEAAVLAVQQLTNIAQGENIALNAAQTSAIVELIGKERLLAIARGLGVTGLEAAEAPQILDAILKREGGAAALKEALDNMTLAGSFAGLAAAVKSATTAVWSFLTTTPVGWAIAAVAAIAALTFAFTKLYDYLEKNSPLAKAKEEAEQAKGATEQLADAVNKLKGKYDELKSAISELSDAKETLSGLTKGTVEWQEAVNTLNGKVLELIKLYPELAATLTTDEDGVMSIDSDALARIQKEQADAIKIAQQTELQANAYANKANDKAKVMEKSNDIANSLDSDIYALNKDGSAKFNETGMTYGASILSSDDVAAIAEKVSKGTDIETALRDFFKATSGQTDTQIDDWLPRYLEANAESIAAMQELAGTISASDTEYKGIMDSAATQLLSGDATYENSEDKDALTALTAKQLEVTEDDVKKAQKDHSINEKKDADNQNNLDAVTEYFQKLYNDKDLEVQYNEDSEKYQIKGTQDEDWTDVAQTTKETLQAAGEFFAVQAKTKSIDIQDNQNNIDKAQQAVANSKQISQEGANQLVNSLVKNNGKLTEEDFNSLSASDLSFLQDNPDYLRKVLGPYLEDLHIDSIDIGNLESIDNIDTPEGIDTGDNTIDENKAVVSAAESTEGKNLLKKASKEGVDTGVLATAMESIDFTAVDAVGEFKTKLEELGITLDKSSPAYQAYIEYITQLNNSCRDGAAQISGYTTALKGIEGVKVGDVISTEDYKALDESVKQFFEDVGDGTYKAVAGYDTMKKAAQEAYKMTEKDVSINSDQSVQNMYADELKDLDDLDRAYADGIINEKAYKAQIDKRAEAAIEAGEMTREAYDSQIKSLKTAIAKEQGLKKNSKQTEQAAKNLAAAINRQNAGFKSLSANIEDNIKNLKQLDETSTEYQNSLVSMKSSVSDIFNVDTSNISDSFITDNLDLLEKLSKGGKEAKAAYQELKTELANDQITMNIDKSKIQGDVKSLEADLTSQIEALDLPNLEVGASIDDSEYVATLENMVKSGAITATAAQQALSAIGFKAEPIYETIREPIIEWSSDSTKANTAGASEMAKHMTTVPVVKGYKETEVFVGLDTGKGGGYKGGDVSLPSAKKDTNSGGSGSQYKPKHTEKMENEYDPYEKWEERLTRISHQLSIIQTKNEHLSGEAYLKNLEKQYKLLKQQDKILEKERKTADKYQNTTAQNLSFTDSKKEHKELKGKKGNKKLKIKGSKKSVKYKDTLAYKAKKAGLNYKKAVTYQKDENGKIQKDENGNKIVDNQKTRNKLVKQANKKSGKEKTKKIKKGKNKGKEKGLGYSDRSKAQDFITNEFDKAVEENEEATEKVQSIEEQETENAAARIENVVSQHEMRIQLKLDTQQLQKDLDQLNLDSLETQLARIDGEIADLNRTIEHGPSSSAGTAYDQLATKNLESAAIDENKAAKYTESAKANGANIREIGQAADINGVNDFPSEKTNRISGIINSITWDPNTGEINVASAEAALKALDAEKNEASLDEHAGSEQWQQYREVVEQVIENVSQELGENASNVQSAISAQNSAKDKRQAAQDAQWEKFSKTWELKVSTVEARKAINDLGISLQDALTVESDVWMKLNTALSTANNSALALPMQLNKASAAMNAINSEMKDFTELGFGTVKEAEDFTQATMEELENTVSDLTSQLSNLYSMIPEVLGQSMNIFQEWSALMDRSVNMAESLSNIWQGFGSNSEYLGWQNANLQKKRKVSQEKVDVLLDMVPKWLEKRETAQADYDKAKEAYNKLQYNPNNYTAEQKTQIEADYKFADSVLKEINNKVYTSMDELVQDFATIAETTFTEMKNNLNDTVEKSFAEFNNGKSLKDTKTEYQWLQTTSSRYLDKTENPYQIGSFSRYAEKLISDTTDITNQERLTSIYQEQLKILKEKDKLTQYDVDRAKKLLDIELARQALENVKNNKASLKLRRDASGNYSYQYVADEDKIREAEENLANKENELYEFDKKRIQSVTSTTMTDMENYMNEIKAIYNAAERDETGNITDTAWIEEEVNRLKTKYGGNIQDDIESLYSAYANTSESSGLDWMNLSGDEFVNTLTAAGVPADLIQNLQKFTDPGVFDTWINTLGTNVTDITTDGVKTLQEVYTQMNNLIAQYEGTLKSSLEIQNEIKQAENEIAKELPEIRNKIEQTIESIQKANKAISDLYELLKKQWGTEADDPGSADEFIASSNTSTTSNSAVEISATSNTSNVPTAATDLLINNLEQLQAQTNTSSTLDFSTIMPILEEISKLIEGSNTSNTAVINIQTGVQALLGKTGTVDADSLTKLQSIIATDTSAVTFKTGGYTGTWSDSTAEAENGKLAWLHQKELILNARDTTNMLAAVGMVRDMEGFLHNLDLSTAQQMLSQIMTLTSQKISSVSSPKGGGNVKQDIVINAEFPNATDHTEIETAFDNLVHAAWQYAGEL